MQPLPCEIVRRISALSTYFYSSPHKVAVATRWVAIFNFFGADRNQTHCKGVCPLKISHSTLYANYHIPISLYWARELTERLRPHTKLELRFGIVKKDGLDLRAVLQIIDFPAHFHRFQPCNNCNVQQCS